MAISTLFPQHFNASVDSTGAIKATVIENVETSVRGPRRCAPNRCALAELGTLIEPVLNSQSNPPNNCLSTIRFSITMNTCYSNPLATRSADGSRWPGKRVDSSRWKSIDGSGPAVSPT